MSHILVIEDESNIAVGIKLNLELAGHDVVIKDRGDEGFSYWKETKVDLIVLDLMLPGMSGEKVLEAIREKDDKLPILILSAKDEAQSKIKCFGLGTDDYLAKPFELEEFLLRVERLLKRSSWTPKQSNEKYHFADYWIDFENYEAQGVNGLQTLTEQETMLLRYFVENEGKALKRADILKILGYNEETSTRTIDNFIVRFRKYFELNPKEPIHFISMRSVGYLFSKGEK